MSQIVRPGSDVSVGSWNPFPASPTTLFDKIDEITQNGDADYVYSDVNGDEFEVGLVGVLDPNVHTGHKIRCHAKSPDGSGAKEQITVSLVENGTVIASSPATGVGRTSYGLIEYALSEAEANLIQNYANLRLRFHISKVNGGESIRITQAEFEVPDVVETTQYGRPDGDITVGNWSPYPADPATLFDKIDEETPDDDASYIVSSTDEDECEISLGAVTDPEVGTGHKIRCYAKSPAGGGAAEQMWIALVENGTERARSATANVNRTAYGLIEYTLSEAEANSITNYANLRLRFHITKTDPDEPIRITQAEFECPSATEEHSGSSSISGNGSLTSVAKKGGKQSSLISAKGAIVAIGLVTMFGIASISSGGTVAAIGQKATQADVVISGGGTVAATGTKAEGEPHSGSASISGNGAVTVQGEKEASDAATISGGGTIVATGTRAEGEPHSGSAAISGGGAVLSEGEKGTEGSPTVFGNGALVSIGKKETEGISLISGNGSISTVGEKQEGEPHYGNAIISGGGKLVLTGTKLIWATGTQVSREEPELLLIKKPKDIIFIGKEKPVFISKK